MPWLSSDHDALDALTFGLAAWAAYTSYRARQRWKLDLRGRAAPPFDRVNLEIFNPAHRPLTIRKGELRYGTNPQFSDLVIEVPDTENLVLEPSRAKPSKPLVADLRKAIADRGIKQKSYSRLWFVVTAYNGRTYSTMVEIDPAIITKPYIPQAEIYIAADLLLGFPQRVSGIQKHWKIK
jgi:hypothetical protein